MPSLKEVKGRISSVISTQQITKAMKMVAAAKLRKAQDKIIQIRPYAKKLDELMIDVSGAQGEESEIAYAEQREENKILIVAVTSDRGLCGGFNSNVQKTVIRTIQEKYQKQNEEGNLEILPIGTKARDFFLRRGYKIVDNYSELFSNLSFESAKEAAEYVMESFTKERYDKIDLVYNEFKNVAMQVVREETFLPIILSQQEEKKTALDYIYEPNQEEIFKALIPKALKIKFYRALLESNASEHGARMTAMDKATENAGELLKELRLTYNRTRQAAITKEILEIVGGAEALAKA